MSRFLRIRQLHLLILVVWGMASVSGVDVSPDLHKIDPAVRFGAVAARTVATQLATGTEAGQQPPLSVLIRLAHADDTLPDQVRNLGGSAREILPRIFAARLPADAMRFLSNRPEVAYIESDRIVRPLLDVSRPAVSADLVQQGSSPPLPQAFRGDNVVVGIVDTGLYGTHPDFTGRIAHTFSPPALSLDPLEDTAGHGTHVTGIAAGDGTASGGKYIGMAPGAPLFIGRAGAESFTTTAILDTVADFVTYADSQVPISMPIAINLSLGVSIGPHDGTSTFESAIDQLATSSSGRKRVIAVAAGNGQGYHEHFRTVLPPFGSVTIPLSLEHTGSVGEVDIWADGADLYTVTATLGQESASAPSGGTATSTGGNVAVSNRVDTPINGATHIVAFFMVSSNNSPATVVLARTRNAGGGRVDAYVDDSQGVFTTAVDAGTVTEPANANHVIAVGSFNTKHFPSGLPDTTEGISTFSSLGPTRDGRTKPDVTAPGFVIYSARSLEAPVANYTYGVVDNNYAILAGTSMATPHVTGVAALVWQSNPALTAAQMRARLTHTANSPSDGSAAPNNTWGYGKLDALAAVADSVAAITAPATAAPGASVTLTSENSSGPLGDAITAYQWSAPGASVTPAGSANPTFQADAPGNYTVSLVVTSGGTDSAPDSTTIHVNRVPSAQVTGPSTDNVGTSVSFSGAGSSDPDAQAITYRWVLVSRPAGSTATLLGGNVPNASLNPDKAGTYEVGLRVDDGLDNSALAIHSLAATGAGPTSSSGGGGGGCSAAIGTGGGASSAAAALLLLFPLGVLAATRQRGGLRLGRAPRRD